MIQVLFREIAYIDRLKKGGFDDAQARASAEALGEALSEVVATKADIAEVKAELGAVKSELNILENHVKSELNILENRMTVKLGSMMIAGFGLMVAIKFFG